MKSLFILFAIPFLLAGFFSPEKPKSKKEIPVKALKLKPEYLTAFQKAPQLGTYTLDEKGVLRPLTSYKIVYYLDLKEVVLMPENYAYRDYEVATRFDRIELPGGAIAYCDCMQASDNCMFRTDGHSHKFKCSGGCLCGVSIGFGDRKPLLEYETMEGDWNDF